MKIVTTYTDRQLLEARVPWYLGRAYRQYDMRATVFAVIGVNFLIGWWIDRVYPFLRRGVAQKRQEAALGIVQKEVWNHGYAVGLEDAMRKVSEVFNLDYDPLKDEELPK